MASFWQGLGDFGHPLGHFWLHFGILKLVLIGFWPIFVFLLAQIWTVHHSKALPTWYASFEPNSGHNSLFFCLRLLQQLHQSRRLRFWSPCGKQTTDPSWEYSAALQVPCRRLGCPCWDSADYMLQLSARSLSIPVNSVRQHFAAPLACSLLWPSPPACTHLLLIR